MNVSNKQRKGKLYEDVELWNFHTGALNISVPGP